MFYIIENMRELYRRRMPRGNRLMQVMTFEVVEDIVKYFTRMLSDFEHNLIVRARSKKMDTKFREAITVSERFAIWDS
jgi:hypothetical protein